MPATTNKVKNKILAVIWRLMIDLGVDFSFKTSKIDFFFL